MINKLIIKINNSIWIYPILYTIISLLGAIIIFLIDNNYFFEIDKYLPNIFFTSTSLARNILGIIAGSLITMTTFTFSTTMVVLTMYSSQYSPRTIENFLKNKNTMKVFGIFMGGFVYSIVSLLFIRESSASQTVVSASIGVIYSIISLVYFSIFINDVGSFVQANNLIDRLYNESINRINEYKKFVEKGKIQRKIQLDKCIFIKHLRSKESGYIQLVDYNKIYKLTDELSCIVIFEKVIGQFVSKGSIIFSVYILNDNNNKNLNENIDKFLNTITLGIQKTESQDFNFSFQKITEVALRAISPGINDPNTAIHCIRILGVLLSMISDLDNGYIVIENSKKENLAIFEAIDFEKELYFCFSQIIHYGKNDPSVILTLFKALRFAMENATNQNKELILYFSEYIWGKCTIKDKKNIDYKILEKEKSELYTFKS